MHEALKLRREDDIHQNDRQQKRPQELVEGGFQFPIWGSYAPLGAFLQQSRDIRTTTLWTASKEVDQQIGAVFILLLGGHPRKNYF